MVGTRGGPAAAATTEAACASAHGGSHQAAMVLPLGPWPSCGASVSSFSVLAPATAPGALAFEACAAAATVIGLAAAVVSSTP